MWRTKFTAGICLAKTEPEICISIVIDVPTGHYKDLIQTDAEISKHQLLRSRAFIASPAGWLGCCGMLSNNHIKPRFSIRPKIRHTGEGRYPDN